MPAESSNSISKVWFITGAGSRFGRAFAHYALGRGHRVVATASTTDRLQEIAARAPDRVALVPLDMTRHGDAEAAIAAAKDRFGRIDVLLNAAGHGASSTLEETTDAQLRDLMETSFHGVMAVTRAALPGFRAQRSGAIVNMSSMGEHPSSFQAAGKFALEGASEALAQELAPFGVRVLVVEPGRFFAQRAASGSSAAGDPAKAAAAVETALDADVTPLRLALGGDAVDVMRNHCKSLLADLAKWEPISRATGF